MQAVVITKTPDDSVIYFKEDRRLENIAISGNSFTSYNDASVASSKAKNGNRPKNYIKIDNGDKVRGT